MPKRVFSQTFGVVAGLLVKDGKFLLVREARRKGPDHGKWNHPAGWIEVGENPLSGVKREVLEESGYAFEPTHILGIYSLVRSDIAREVGGTPHAIKVVFLGKISENPAGDLHDDVSETRWFTREEIKAMDGSELRDVDIKQMVDDYFEGRAIPLNRLIHTIQT